MNFPGVRSNRQCRSTSFNNDLSRRKVIFSIRLLSALPLASLPSTGSLSLLPSVQARGLLFPLFHQTASCHLPYLRIKIIYLPNLRKFKPTFLRFYPRTEAKNTLNKTTNKKMHRYGSYASSAQTPLTGYKANKTPSKKSLQP